MKTINVSDEDYEILNNDGLLEALARGIRSGRLVYDGNVNLGDVEEKLEAIKTKVGAREVVRVIDSFLEACDGHI